jgi:hypothetical protein
MIIKDQKDLFDYIDSDFENWNVDDGGEYNPNVKEKIMEINFKFSDVFTDKDVVTQQQIIDWVTENKDKIKNEITFFLVKNSNGTRFVVVVYVRGDELKVRMDEFEHVYVWSGSNLHRVFTADTVTPKTPTLSHSDSLKKVEDLAIEFCVKWCDSKAQAVIELRDKILELK